MSKSFESHDEARAAHCAAIVKGSMNPGKVLALLVDEMNKGNETGGSATTDLIKDACQPVTCMNFGHALQALKDGHKVARAGWNGKRMWIALTPGSVIDARHARLGHAARHRADELQADLPHDGTENVIELLPHIDMRAADGSMVVGWLASQTDMLANDWMIISEDA